MRLSAENGPLNSVLLNSIKRDYILGKMLAADVTFLDDQVLDASHISVVRRQFRKRTAKAVTGIETEVESEFGLFEYF